jgi:hypothetical protein
MAASDEPPRTVGIATALAYVEAGLLLLGGLLLLLISTSIADAVGINGAIVAVLGLLAIGLGGIFIRGARLVRTGTSRTLLLVSSGLVALLQVVSLGNLIAGSGTTAGIVMAVIFLAIPVVIVVQLLQAPTAQWLRGRPEA